MRLGQADLPGDLPSRMAERISKAILSKSSSRRLMPRLDSDRVFSEAACARAALYSMRCLRPHFLV